MQAVALLPQLGQQEERMIGVEPEGLHEIGLLAVRLFPEEVLPGGVERRNACNAGDFSRRLQIGRRERVLAAEAIFACAHDEQIAIELAQHAERCIEKTTLKPELHQHQQYREADPGNRAYKAQLVRDEIPPRE